MINVSNEFKQVVSGQSRKFYAEAEITLSDGTVLNLTSADIVGMSFEDATSQNGLFTIGSAIINELKLTINNIDDTYSKYDFTDAVIRPTVGLQLSETVETLSKGVFTAVDPKSLGSTISISAYDNMSKFDKPFSDVAYTFPCSASELLSAVCTHCGVLLTTTTFTNSDFEIAARPVDEAINCREIVSWIAQIAGCFARCNTSGQLEIKWYNMGAFEQSSLDGGTFETTTTPYSDGDTADGGNFADYTSGYSFDGGTFTQQSEYHHIYAMTNQNIATDDVVITGISVTDSAETPNTVLFGQSGYSISIEGNKLVQSLNDATTISNSVGAKIVGMRFRPMSITAISDPSREAGDVAYVTDRKNNTYQTLLSNVMFGVYQQDKLTCDAEPSARNSATRYSDTAKAIVEARTNTNAKLSSYDLTVQQLTNLITNGFGMFKTEVVDESGGTIYYMHDKPVMDESSVRWFMTSEGIIEQNKVDGVWVTVSGTDKHGNALYNVLTARKISAAVIYGDKLYSNDGATLIDMEKGVANSDNISVVDNVQSGFPLKIPFNIDDDTGSISKVVLKWTIDKFRTSSTTASSGGSSTVTSNNGGSDIISSENNEGYSTSVHGETGTSGGIFIDYSGSVNQSTGITNGTIGNHAHSITIGSHTHSASSSHTHSYTYSWELPAHTHSIETPDHTHDIDIPSHTHPLNFGIQEQDISSYAFAVYIDGVLRQTIADSADNAQGIINLTQYITSTGWHSIELRSSTLKRISAQLVIKSYIKM